MVRFVAVALWCSTPIAAAIFWWTWQQHIPINDPDTAPPVVQVTESANEPHELDWYAPLWRRDLRQTLFPENQEVAPESRPKGPVLTVLATLVEPNGRFAHLQGTSGRTELKGVNEKIDEFQITAIEPGRVQLERGTEHVWVTVPDREEASR